MLPSTTSATDAFTITPSDGTQLQTHVRSIYVGTGGNITVTMPSGDVQFPNVPDGAILPVQTSWVKATGTTATNLVGMV